MRLLFALCVLALGAQPCSARAAPSGGDSPGTPVLVYHRFGAVVSDGMTVTTRVFEEQLRFLRDRDYTVIPARRLVAYLRGQAPAPPPRSVVITADDGHRSVYSEMFPLVARYRIPVTLFVYPSAISNASYAMTWEQLKALADSGLFDVQSHTYWHPNFRDEKRRLPAREYEKLVATQLVASKELLESRLHTRVDLLAWPFGIYDDGLMRRAAQAGYAAGFTLERRPAGRRDPIMALPRYLVRDADRGAAFERLLTVGSHALAARGKVVDRATQKPIAQATVTLGATVARSDADGSFEISGRGDTLGVRAPGYLRADAVSLPPAEKELVVALTPFTPKALYLSFFGIGNRALREAALKLIEETELNALVIDVKGDRGMISYRSAVPLAAEAGAQKIIPVPDIKALLATLRLRGIYTIGRIVVFKDDPLASSHPRLAVKTAGGQVWRDRENLAWSDPFRREVWDYNVEIAVEAARTGFDEIQFDYVRFPDERGLVFSQPSTERNRVAAISGFLDEARKRLAPYNVFVAADIFGYVLWNPDDTDIGERLEDIASRVDYLSPMLYPSGFQFGIPGLANPVAHPFEIVYRSLMRGRERSGLAATRFRPWLQAFRDYAFDRRPFAGAAVRAQIQAAEDFGSDGWMLWNPHNIYSKDGLREARRPKQPNAD